MLINLEDNNNFYKKLSEQVLNANDVAVECFPERGTQSPSLNVAAM